MLEAEAIQAAFLAAAGDVQEFCSPISDDERLDFAHDCGYLSKHDHALFTEKCREVGAMLGSMISDPSSFILRATSGF